MEPCTSEGYAAQSAAEFYRDALQALVEARVPFVVGGAYAFQHYAGIARDTKDFDIFLHPRDVGPPSHCCGAAATAPRSRFTTGSPRPGPATPSWT